MLKQSNALRRLENVLTEAVKDGDRNQPAGPILLQAMNLSIQPQNIVDFYELLNRAEDEARSIRNKPKIDRYLQVIKELYQVFIVNFLWNEKWNVFASHIENKGVLNTLDALAEFLSLQKPTVFLEQDFLEKLTDSVRKTFG